MKSGTPGFNGERLKEAREVRGLSVVELSEILDISRQVIYKYEKGAKTPSPETLNNLSRQLNFPKQFFLTLQSKRNENTIFFRSMSSATKRERIRAKHKLFWLKEILGYIQRFVYLKEVNIPDFEIKEPLKISFDEIETIASECRRFWELGDNPISNVIMLFENNGIIVTRGMLGSEKLDALSELDAESYTPYVFLNADKDNAARSKFDICHEIGHMVLHRSVNNKTLSTPKDFKLIEDQAHRFAASFLLPEETFLNDLQYISLDSFWLLKEKWKVSIALMIKRCHDLNIIDDNENRRHWINLGRRGWRKKEPLDNTLQVEKPQFLNRAIRLLIDKKVQTKEDIVANIPFPRSAIEELTGLPRGYLETKATSVEPFPRLRNHRHSNKNSGISAKVIPLKKNKTAS